MTQSEAAGAQKPRHLIHVGYNKAGSTALQRWFDAHPAVSFARMGFGGYRKIDDLLSEATRGIDRPGPVVTSFELLISPSGRVQDHACPHATTLMPRAPARARVREVLLSLFPDAHILIVTRGFRAMIFSLYSEAVRGGASSSLEDFARFLAQLADRGLSGLDYDAVIGEYVAAFGAERVTVLPFELLAQDPQAFVAKLDQMLGLTGSPPITRARPGLSPWRLYCTSRISGAIERSPLPAKVKSRVFRWHVRRARFASEGPLTRWLAAYPRAGFTADHIPAEAVEAFRGRASRLAEQAVFQPFAKEYLFDE